MRLSVFFFLSFLSRAEDNDATATAGYTTPHAPTTAGTGGTFQEKGRRERKRRAVAASVVRVALPGLVWRLLQSVFDYRRQLLEQQRKLSSGSCLAVRRGGKESTRIL